MQIIYYTLCLLAQTILCVQLIAVGPTTAAEMSRRLGRVDGTAARPDAQHVCHVITRLSRHSSVEVSVTGAENQ